MITFTHNDVSYTMCFTYEPVTVEFWSHGVEDDAVRQGTKLEIRFTPRGEQSPLLQQAFVTHNPHDAPSLESARRYAIRKLVDNNWPFIENRELRRALYQAYFASHECKKSSGRAHGTSKPSQAGQAESI